MKKGLYPKESKEVLRNNIEKNINSPFKEYLINKIKPTIKLRSSEINIATKISKIGGIPLVENSSWPRSKNTHKLFSFLAQIDLGEMSHYDLDNELPNKGLLSFYFDFDSFNEGKVVYYPDVKSLRMAKIPKLFSAEINRRKLPFWKRIFTKRMNYEIFKECSLFGRNEYNIPSWDSIQMKSFHKSNNTKSSDLLIEEEFIVNYINERETNHQLLGYYIGLQESIYELFLDDISGRFPRKITPNQLIEAQKWRLLAQIDSDRLAQLNWMDSGKILFFIKDSDLKIANFNNTKAIVDST